MKFEQENEQQILDKINKEYRHVSGIKVEDADSYTGSIRTMLELSVKYFYLKKYGEIPVWADGHRERFTLGNALVDDRFRNCFNAFIFSDMMNIKNTCNTSIHSAEPLSLEAARDMLGRIETCIHRIEDVLQLKIICGMEIREPVVADVTAQSEPAPSPKPLNVWRATPSSTPAPTPASSPEPINHIETPMPVRRELPDKGSMSKSRAIRFLQSRGYRLAAGRTFASKNRGAYNYWANPEFLLLQSDWSLILNDWISKKLYLFTIPANSIRPSELTPRSDRGYLIDLQIMYRDPTFTDNRSGYSFAKFLTAEVDY